jgi:hypothetical protein
MNDVTSEGKQAITAWLIAQREVEGARDLLSRRQTDLLNAESALAKWRLPPDAKPGEKIAVWFGDSLIQVEVGGLISGVGEVRHQSSTRVTIRTRGKHLNELR